MTLKFFEFGQNSAFDERQTLAAARRELIKFGLAARAVAVGLLQTTTTTLFGLIVLNDRFLKNLYSAL